jgi:hypothetical protein
MNLYSVLLAIIVLAVCAYFGVLRPTGARKTSDAIWQRSGSIKTMGKSKAASVGGLIFF